MGFRSYVRHFWGAILGLLRPSEAWCFAAGRWFLPLCFPILGPEVKVAKIHSSSKRKKEPKASFSIGFRSYVRHFRVQFWGFSVLQRHGVFPSGDQQQQQQQKFLQKQEVSEVTLGIFGVQFWGFSVIQRHGVSLPGGDFFHGDMVFSHPRTRCVPIWGTDVKGSHNS